MVEKFNDQAPKMSILTIEWSFAKRLIAIKGVMMSVQDQINLGVKLYQLFHENYDPGKLEEAAIENITIETHRFANSRLSYATFSAQYDINGEEGWAYRKITSILKTPIAILASVISFVIFPILLLTFCCEGFEVLKVIAYLALRFNEGCYAPLIGFFHDKTGCYLAREANIEYCYGMSALYNNLPSDDQREINERVDNICTLFGFIEWDAATEQTAAT